ncbi:hypothetical protein [Sulfurimonas sp.]|uniref:hypothetical protein n=1 Tax=Sulfurimonas sp. TaxID=2022749 RepID=UPI003565A628
MIEKSLNIKEIFASLELNELQVNSSTHTVIGNAPVLHNGLNLLFAPQCYKKNYTAVSIAMETELSSIYFALESNGKVFLDHCKKHNVIYKYIAFADSPFEYIKMVLKEIKNAGETVFVIIDNYLDLFLHDNITERSVQLDILKKYFIEEIKMPILLLDHAIEIADTKNGGYKIEYDNLQKYKKSVTALSLHKIDNNIQSGTLVKVEHSLNPDLLPTGHTKFYNKSHFLAYTIKSNIDKGNLPQEFTLKRVQNILSSNDMELWKKMKNDIAISFERGKTTFWRLR